MSDLYVCMYKHAKVRGPGACSPRKFLEIRCSKIASEQSCSSYIHGSRSIASNFWLSMCTFAKLADFEFHERRY